jgi:hypothetical protein
MGNRMECVVLRVVLCRRSIALAHLVFCTALFAFSTHAQGSSNCSGGGHLQLSSTTHQRGSARSQGPLLAPQGALVLIELQSPQALKEATAEWDGGQIPFWLPAAGASRAGRKNSRADTRRGLLGVDLEKPTGPYTVKVKARTADGANVSCAAQVVVTDGKFAVERLQVGKQFAEPSPEQLQRAKEEQQRLRGLFDATTPERLWQGRFRLPLDRSKNARNFGKRRIINGQPGSPHTGVDFPTAEGTPVHAAQAGRVVLAEELFFSGNTVVLDHGLGVYSLYGHLLSIGVKAGQIIGVGTILGKVGATGRVTGTHLHWGLTVNTAKVDPLTILRLPP